MEATIIFKDGTTLEVEKNADCYIVASKPEFPEDLSEVVIQSEEGNRTVEDAELVECASIDGRYWFTFASVPQAEKEKKAMQEEIDMLTECILEMSEIIYGE